MVVHSNQDADYIVFLPGWWCTLIMDADYKVFLPGWCTLIWILMKRRRCSLRAGLRDHMNNKLGQISSPVNIVHNKLVHFTQEQGNIMPRGFPTQRPSVTSSKSPSLQSFLCLPMLDNLPLPLAPAILKKVHSPPSSSSSSFQSFSSLHRLIISTYW